MTLSAEAEAIVRALAVECDSRSIPGAPGRVTNCCEAWSANGDEHEEDCLPFQALWWVRRADAERGGK